MKDYYLRTPYEQVCEFSSMLGGQYVHFISKPGLPDWDTVSPASKLLAEHFNLSHATRLLFLGCGHGALAVVLARRFPRAELWLMDLSCIALKMCELTLHANQINAARIHKEISVLPEQAGKFDAVLIDLPKGRKLAQRWLVEAYTALKSGGELYLAGPNNRGIQSVAKDAADIFGDSSVLGYKKGNRVIRFRKSESAIHAPDWSQSPGISPGTWLEIEVEIPGSTLKLRSLPGVFSAEKLDGGTRLLLSALNIPPAACVLDLGCGYGILGLYAALSGADQVDLVDSNLLAVAAARENLAVLGIQKARAIPSDVLSAVPDGHYTCAITNPPFHTGQSVDYQMAMAFIDQTWKVLEPGGQFWIVANRFIRYDRFLNRIFGSVETVHENERYHVLRAVK